MSLAKEAVNKNYEHDLVSKKASNIDLISFYLFHK